MESREQKIQRLIREEIHLVPYNPKWPELFLKEKEHLLSCLPPVLLKRIEHFGSTAIPGLSAKPVIDILVEVTDLEATQQEIVPLLEKQGYDYLWRPTHGENEPPFYAWFIKRDPLTGVRTHHIHCVENHFQEHWDRLLFRDYLREHPATAKEYEALKFQLGGHFVRDRISYTEGKRDYIARITEWARKYYQKKE